MTIYNREIIHFTKNNNQKNNDTLFNFTFLKNDNNYETAWHMHFLPTFLIERHTKKIFKTTYNDYTKPYHFYDNFFWKNQLIFVINSDEKLYYSTLT